MNPVLRSALTTICLLWPAAGAPASDTTEVNRLPENFSFEHRSCSVGVIPREEDFIEIRPVDPTNRATYTLIAGTMTRDGNQTSVTNVFVRKHLTEAQCMAVYKEALALGFFSMKDNFLNDPAQGETGGTRTTTMVTANDVTKKVSVYGVKVPEIDKLIDKVRRLQ